MKEELLKSLKKELEEEKEKIIKHNQKVKRVKELLKEPCVKEYISLTGLTPVDLKQIKTTDTELILSLYRKHLYKIDKQDTNGIYVYLGTYDYSYETDIVHGGNDIRVAYNSKDAKYRIYWDIEQCCSECIPISKCEKFEDSHFILDPKTYFKEQEYYKIQQDFFVKAIKTNQENAKKMILNKYRRFYLNK